MFQPLLRATPPFIRDLQCIHLYPHFNCRLFHGETAVYASVLDLEQQIVDWSLWAQTADLLELQGIRQICYGTSSRASVTSSCPSNLTSQFLINSYRFSIFGVHAALIRAILILTSFFSCVFIVVWSGADYLNLQSIQDCGDLRFSCASCP